MKSLLGASVPSLRWRLGRPPFPGQRSYERVNEQTGLSDGLVVLESSAINSHDGRLWYHVSCSYEDHLPSWEDLKEVKQSFIGDNRTAIQVFPPRSQWVNIHAFCLHLWVCLDDPDAVPRFDWQGSI